MPKIKLMAAGVAVVLLATVILGCPSDGDNGNADNNGNETPPVASFSLLNLSISSGEEVPPNETVSISVNVANTGNAQGSHNVILNINGVQEASQTVSLSPGSSQGVTFEVSKQAAGVYNVTIGNLSGSFTVTIMEIIFPDPALETAIRWALDKPQGPIYAADMESITVLFLETEGRGITNLTGLEYCINLETLNLWANNISDLSPLAGLANLQLLALQDNNIVDVSPLAGLTNLTALYLGINNISDISPLAGLVNLEYLTIKDNNVSDISPLIENSGLSTGDYVHLVGNPLDAVSLNVYIPQLKARGVEVEY